MTDPGFQGNNGADPETLEKDGISFAQQAVTCDQQQQHAMAMFFYTEAAQALLNAVMSGSRMPGITDKAHQYITRAEELKKMTSHSTQAMHQTMTSHQLDLERARFLIKQAFDEDDVGNEQEAIDLYTEAVELCLKIRSGTSDTALQDKVKKLATQALDSMLVKKFEESSKDLTDLLNQAFLVA
ncbi:calpain-7-like [Mercenaria mercenaria]|uniref:calpain-7-like n=1 Tax=Mercenaria mercenaria TaxID=6596 RepID=UPI00234E43AE|nr:calpain-7-like [Mercenaria mercenaria]